MDTGADFTSVHWTDRERLRDAAGNPLPANAALAGTGTASGISGSSVVYGIEEAELLFVTDDKRAQVAVVEARIAMNNTSAGVPSLLGRDVLSAVHLSLDMPANRLVLEWPS